MSLAELVTEALALPLHARAYLAEALLESLDYNEDFPVNTAWLREIQRRTEEIDGGLAVLPAEQILSELRTQYSR